ncbi:MAG: T9SS type A sorting domain-containing protein, partial [Bacteroidia bacterium]|nr:T9SS type A sorting domain-containing protein [Bacteroidia bacterium]
WSNGSAAQSITVSAGSYWVKVKNTAGTDSATSNSVNVNYYLPDTTISGSQFICFGDSVVLSGPAGSWYQWFPNADTTQQITVSTAGNFWLHYIDTNNCFVVTDTIQTTTLTQLNTPLISLAGSDLFCNETNVAYQWYLNAVLINGASSQNYSPLQNGNYTVLITDTFGCSALSNSLPVTDAGIKKQNSENLFTIYSESDMLVLNFLQQPSEYLLSIYSVEGKRVHFEKLSGFNQQKIIDISKLASGIYQITVSASDFVLTKKIIVRK